MLLSVVIPFYHVEKYIGACLERAAQLLTQGRSVQQAADECGFEDYFFFINSFKKAHGISPAAYGRKDGERG